MMYLQLPGGFAVKINLLTLQEAIAKMQSWARDNFVALRQQRNTQSFRDKQFC